MLATQVRQAVQDGLGPFAPPVSLGERSTFQWDQLAPGSPKGVHRRITSFRDAEVPRLSPSAPAQCDASMLSWGDWLLGPSCALQCSAHVWLRLVLAGQM